MMRRLLWVPIFTLLVWGCFRESVDECIVIPDTEGVKLELSFTALQDSFVDVSSKDRLVTLLTRHPEIRDQIFRRAAYPNDSVFINVLFDRFNDPHLDTLRMETVRVFGDGSELRRQFEEALKNLRFYYPNAKLPRIKTLISGLDTDLLVTDSLIVVSLDFYLGEGAKYRPQMYDYLLRQYSKSNIVPSCMLLYGIGSQYNTTDATDKTVLGDMIAYGKSFYFAKHMLPCVPDSVLMGYSAAEMNGSRENENLIWARLIEDQVLYSTSHLVKQKYLGERPKTLEVGEKCPGRIAQWIGWQIVKSYERSHAEVDLPKMMSMAKADKFFKESRYRPLK